MDSKNRVERRKELWSDSPVKEMLPSDCFCLSLWKKGLRSLKRNENERQRSQRFEIIREDF